MAVPVTVAVTLTAHPVRVPVAWADGPEELPEWEGVSPLVAFLSTERGTWRKHVLQRPARSVFPRLVRRSLLAQDLPQGKPVSPLEALSRVFRTALKDSNPYAKGSPTREAVLWAAENAGLLVPFKVERAAWPPLVSGEDLVSWLAAAYAVGAWRIVLRLLSDGHSYKEIRREVFSRFGLEFASGSNDLVRSQSGNSPDIPLWALNVLEALWRKKPKTQVVRAWLREAALSGLVLDSRGEFWPFFSNRPEEPELPLAAPKWVATGGVYHLALLQLAQARKKERLCVWCGGGILGRGDKRYCSNACRQAAYRAKKKVGTI